MSRERQGWLLLAAILLPLLWVKFNTNALMVDLGVDGSYYMDVADHVRQGLGLRTEVSLYHQGMIGFPHPTPVYPLWPMLLGWVARFTSLDGAAVWLPTVLYFLSLLIGYVWAKGLSDRPIFPGIWELPHAGHLVVVILALNDLYFEHSSKPYTEPMAFVFLFAALIRFRSYFQAPTLLRGLEAGVWLAVLLLIRSQMIVTAAGFFGAAGLRLLFPASQESRSRAAVGLGGSILGYGLGLLPQILFLRSFIPNAGFRDLLRFDAWQANPRLPILNLLVPTDGLWGWIVDRSQGFALAFSESSSFSFQASCSYYYLALPTHRPGGGGQPPSGPRCPRPGPVGQPASRWLQLRLVFCAIFCGMVAIPPHSAQGLLHRVELRDAARPALPVPFRLLHLEAADPQRCVASAGDFPSDDLGAAGAERAARHQGGAGAG
jgi:hypothetical protein